MVNINASRFHCNFLLRLWDRSLSSTFFNFPLSQRFYDVFWKAYPHVSIVMGIYVIVKLVLGMRRPLLYPDTLSLSLESYALQGFSTHFEKVDFLGIPLKHTLCFSRFDEEA